MAFPTQAAQRDTSAKDFDLMFTQHELEIRMDDIVAEAVRDRQSVAGASHIHLHGPQSEAHAPSGEVSGMEAGMWLCQQNRPCGIDAEVNTTVDCPIEEMGNRGMDAKSNNQLTDLSHPRWHYPVADGHCDISHTEGDQLGGFDAWEYDAARYIIANPQTSPATHTKGARHYARRRRPEWLGDLPWEDTEPLEDALWFPAHRLYIDGQVVPRKFSKHYFNVRFLIGGDVQQ
ncbi:hypothetical protein OE88DRAFT_1735716 [Heliocybe sulcata]|uniref:Uncharacterized protein n=1 Tax=Heliocybe sulcata TaxID=5364 RepID=A0A5C3N1D3_9AGAM|nr:hypothetical protein OE88DRAFT_1735716 [Heliocybe sulcata]